MDMEKIRNFVDEDGIVFLSYGGFLTQSLISGMIEALEHESNASEINVTDSTNIFTIFIELSQNMMNYSKSKELDNKKVPEGLIVVMKDDEYNYHIHSQNVVAKEDKEKIEPRLQEIQSLDKDAIKKKYRELRKSGRHTHDGGGGIGFYEIAKRCDSIEYEFIPINEDRYHFHIKTNIITKKGK